VFCSSDFGFVGAPDFSPAIEVGLIQGFSPGALFQGSPIFMLELANCAGAKARFFFCRYFTGLKAGAPTKPGSSAPAGTFSASCLATGILSQGLKPD